MTSFILRIFFIIPIWLLRVLTMKKKIMKNNQILDFQTQIFLSLQSLQSADLESFELIESVDEFRREMTESRMSLPINAKPDSIVSSIDHQINIEENINLSIREYIPESIETSIPILYFHGGGYVIGSIETHDQWLRFFASKMRARIFSLDYRLAPENKFPCALKDANSALEWIAKKDNFSISSISVCGDSAGAHLAASVSTYRTHKNLELPHSQCLIYPMTDPSCGSVSQQDLKTGYFLTHKAIVWFWSQLKKSKNDIYDPCFNLLKDHDRTLPRTLIITAGFDPLCDEGEAYADKIFKAGNEVQQIHYPHLIHGFVNITGLKSAKYAAIDLINTYKTYL